MSMTGQRRLELERARLEALRLEQVRGECAAIAEACEGSLREVREIEVQQLAASELRGCAAALRTLQGRIDEAPDDTRTELLAVSADIQQAIARAEAKARAWTESQERAVSEARQAEVFASSSGASSEAARLGREAVTEAANGNLDTANKLATEARRAAETASATALDERVRREVVKGLLKTLKDMGFVTVGPKLNEGVVVLEGRLASGRRARFDVSLDGDLSFDLDGYEGRSCADDLEKVETTMRDRFGVKLGPPQVVWKNPDRLTKGARDLPSGGRDQKR